MKEKKIFTVTDLGGGDGGKGGVVHKISSHYGAHTVLKVGGAQGSHGVRTSSGQSFNFSQFGCGTFEGARTHVTNLFVVEPYRFLKEGNELIYDRGIRDAFDRITIDEDVLCVTPYHTFATRLKELARKGNPRGTIGVGVGTAFEDSILYPDLAIRAGLIEHTAAAVLDCVRLMKLKELAPIIENVGDLLPEDQETARKLIEMFQDQDLVATAWKTFREMISKSKVVGREYLKKKILGRDGVVVVESSHGILTDRYYGFHPHTSKLRTTLQPTLDLLSECEYEGEVKKIGVTRAYQIRHGAGPMVTESSELLGELLPGSHKDENRWQGKVRVGALDLVALRYSIGVCGGPTTFDGLAITWFDQVRQAGNWYVCDKYRPPENDEGTFPFLRLNGEIAIHRGEDEYQLQYQEKLGRLLNTCKPSVSVYGVGPSKSIEDVSELCSSVLLDKLGVPVRMISFGPTENDKVLL